MALFPFSSFIISNSVNKVTVLNLNAPRLSAPPNCFPVDVLNDCEADFDDHVCQDDTCAQKSVSGNRCWRSWQQQVDAADGIVTKSTGVNKLEDRFIHQLLLLLNMNMLVMLVL